MKYEDTDCTRVGAGSLQSPFPKSKFKKTICRHDIVVRDLPLSRNRLMAGILEFLEI